MRDFDKLWLGQTLSAIGSAVTTFALPTLAIFTLHATPLQIGLISALALLPFPIFGLLVGVIADRWPRRTILIAADILRFAALASIPITGTFGLLSIGQLYVVALLSGIGSAFFGITYQSYLPSVVPEEQLVEGNTKLEFSNSGAQILGSATGGALVQWLGAALAISLDAFSYVASIISLILIRTREPRYDGPKLTLWQLGQEIREGMSCVFGSEELRRIVAATATGNFGSAVATSMGLLYAYRALHLQPALLGIVLGFAAFGFVGAALAGRIRALFGLRVTLIGSLVGLGAALAVSLIALVALPYVALFFSTALASVVGVIYNINQVSYRQGLVESRLQGRMNATIRTIVWGISPIGSLVGGVLGETLGIPSTIAIGAAITITGVVWLFPLRVQEPNLSAAEA